MTISNNIRITARKNGKVIDVRELSTDNFLSLIENKVCNGNHSLLADMKNKIDKCIDICFSTVHEKAGRITFTAKRLHNMIEQPSFIND